MNIEVEINKAIKKQVNNKIKNISPESRLYEDFGCNSLDIMEIIMATESRLHIKIPNEKIYNINIVNDLYNLFKNATEK